MVCNPAIRYMFFSSLALNFFPRFLSFSDHLHYAKNAVSSGHPPEPVLCVILPAEGILLQIVVCRLDRSCSFPSLQKRKITDVCR